MILSARTALIVRFFLSIGLLILLILFSLSQAAS